MALPDELAVRLSSQGVGSTTSTGTWRITADELPKSLQGSSSQARAVCIVETGGLPWEPGAIFKPTFQVVVRGPASSPTTAREKMDDVITALHRFSGTAGNRRYPDIQLQGDVVYLGLDQNDRPLYSANFFAFRSDTT